MENNLDFDFDFSITPEELAQIKEQQVIVVEEEDNSPPFFKIPPIIELDELEKIRVIYAATRAMLSGRYRKKITQRTVAGVKIKFDGREYTCELSRYVHGKGIKHWSIAFKKQILVAKALLWAEHISTYGNYGQVMPEGIDDSTLKLSEKKISSILDEMELIEGQNSSIIFDL